VTIRGRWSTRTTPARERVHAEGVRARGRGLVGTAAARGRADHRFVGQSAGTKRDGRCPTGAARNSIRRSRTGPRRSATPIAIDVGARRTRRRNPSRGRDGNLNPITRRHPLTGDQVVELGCADGLGDYVDTLLAAARLGWRLEPRRGRATAVGLGGERELSSHESWPGQQAGFADDHLAQIDPLALPAMDPMWADPPSARLTGGLLRVFADLLDNPFPRPRRNQLGAGPRTRRRREHLRRRRLGACRGRPQHDPSLAHEVPGACFWRFMTTRNLAIHDGGAFHLIAPAADLAAGRGDRAVCDVASM
jgi:hypothetical protein